MEAPQNKEPALYRDVLKRAWSIIGAHKFLLIFGFFAAFAANGEQFDVLYKNVDTVVRLQDVVLPTIADVKVTAVMPAFWAFIKTFLIEGAFITTTRFDAALLFLAVILGPLVLAQIAIIASAKRVTEGKETPTFSNGLGDGGRKFLPILGLNLLTKIVVYGLLTIVSYPLFQRYVSADGSSSSIQALAIAAFIILVPLQIVVSFLAKFASAYIVVDGKSFGASIVAAWRLFLRHWLIALEMSFILILINIIASAVVLGTTLNFFPPTGPFSTTLFFLIVFILGSLLAAFQYAAWTMLFLRLENKTAVSKLARWADVVYNTLGARKTASEQK